MICAIPIIAITMKEPRQPRLFVGCEPTDF